LQEVDLIVTSPLARAAETARILAEAFETEHLQTLEALAPGGSNRKILDFLKRQTSHEVVALVGHEPDLGRLAATLVVGAGSLPLKKAGACVLDCGEQVGPAKAKLISFMDPATLRRLGRKKVRA
jgi:phosphohistidine phosphatase